MNWSTWGWLAVVVCLMADVQADDWFDYQPAAEVIPNSPIDLRWLNERVAGENGFIEARDGQFVQGRSGAPVRFWAVNGPPHDLTGEKLKRCARMMAAYGVNLARVHGAIFDQRGEVDPKKIRHAQEVVAAMKAEGIYTHFSIYFPLWFKPPADLEWLTGYDGTRHPFAALQFNPEFQAKHRDWLKALLTTPDSEGWKLIDEPAVFGIEIQNEDSFFFWTFDAKNIPDPQLTLLEKRFGAWLAKKHGSVDAIAKAWQGSRIPRDKPGDGRFAFRPLWNIANERTPRDRDTAAFLLEVQTEFYRDTYRFLRELGFKGLIQTSNWHTASPEVLGPLEKLSYTAGDFIDRHGYFECNHKGDNAAWSIRAGHTYSDRSALRFDPGEPGKPKLFVHPVMDPQYDDKPSMISETTFTRPNRYRSEAPLYFAAYGALQGSDGIVHFAFDGAEWKVKPNYWMQQWTLASPAMLGQFPAAAILYRKGLVEAGQIAAEVRLNRNDVLNLRGTPLPQDAAFDELRLKDVPAGTELKPGQRIDPLVHSVGRTQVRFTEDAGSTTLSDLTGFVNHKKQTVTSNTRQLRLDYGKGGLVIDTPRAQGVVGNVGAMGRVELGDMVVESPLDLLAVMAVSLDEAPLSESKKVLLQVMTEEQASGFAKEVVEDNVYRIKDIGHDPWRVRKIEGMVSFKRPDAGKLRVTPLSPGGRPGQPAGNAARLRLGAETLYYVLEE